MATNISKFISGSGFGSYNHRYNNSVQFRKMTERFKNATSELNYGKNFSIARYIYELNAVQVRYKFLLRQAKASNLTNILPSTLLLPASEESMK